MKPIWIWRSHTNAPQQIGLRIVTPVSRSIGLRWSWGGWLWQYPLAVEVKDEGSGVQQRLPIPDPTRTTIWFLMAFTFAAILIMALLQRQQK